MFISLLLMLPTYFILSVLLLYILRSHTWLGANARWRATWVSRTEFGMMQHTTLVLRACWFGATWTYALRGDMDMLFVYRAMRLRAGRY